MGKKNILGLDLGTTSIGWAHVIEGETPENSAIKQIGSRIIQLDNFDTVDKTGKVTESKDPIQDFASGKGLSPNAGRTLKRGARRNLDRYQDRRKKLIKKLKAANIINTETILSEDGKHTTHETWRLRAKSVTEQLEKEEFARVLLAINKKRGYKSSRKANNEDEGNLIDGMAVAKRLYKDGLTPGQLTFQLLKEGKKYIPDFYRSNLQTEFDRIWNFQKPFYPDILTDNFYKKIKGKGQKATSFSFWNSYGFNTASIKGLEDDLKNEYTIKFSNKNQKKLQSYKWRNDAVSKQLDKEKMAYVVTEINNNIHNSSGYLGAISDRSKKLYFNNQSIGQFLYKQLQKEPHTSLKNQVFYRQDYLDEFEKIWETQAHFHPELTKSLKSEIRDTIIFYQRKLKSQKNLISFCEFESKEIEIEKDGKKKKKNIGLKVAPKSSPLFQEFKIWQLLNNVCIRRKETTNIKKDKNQQPPLFQDNVDELLFDLDTKELLFEELNIKGNLTSKKIIELLGINPKQWELTNYSSLEGNRTNKELYNAYLQILEIEGYDVKNLLKVNLNKDRVRLDDLKVPAPEIKKMVKDIFGALEINTDILEFNSELDGKYFEKQASFQLWHLLYSYEGDDSKSGNERLYQLLKKKFGFKKEHAKILANVYLSDDYGNLSSKAMRKIYPYIKEHIYSEACALAGYRHSKHSLTVEELKNRSLQDKLELLKKNSLRNPVVEKILNQLVNVINTLIEKENKKLKAKGLPPNFHFDEIRIELARELKKNAKERKEMTDGINTAKKRNDTIREILQEEFNIPNPTRSDIIRYRLYEELKNNGYKDLYTNQYIPREKLFSKLIDIEHIIPQSKLFDDSFSNKTVVYRKNNLEKGNQTAFDYINQKFGAEGIEKYNSRLKNLFEFGKKNKEEGISKAKYQKLQKRENEINDGFIERDLRESQFIAKKAKEMLFQITKNVVSTSGKITNRLREDWDLINIMKELNLPKYRALGLTKMQKRKYGHTVEIIEDWSKRNDHRHHAMDALTVAFTKHNHIQYLNNLNARKNEREKKHSNIIAIENKETKVRVDDQGNRKRVFKEPIPHFRQVAKTHLENLLISHKSKNKVATKNKNRINTKKKDIIQITSTPRGQLHKETIYGRYHYYKQKEAKIGSNFDKKTIEKVANPTFKKLLLQRLEEYGNNPKKAFSGSNSLKKKPIYLNENKTGKLPEKVKLVWLEENYSIRKEVNPDNFKNLKSIDKILDEGIKRILKIRLKEYDNDAKLAFSNLERNPIWLNKEKGISIKRVTITGVKNAASLHLKKDHFGHVILDKKGKPIPVDYVSTGNNHHVAIYKDEKGKLQEKVVSFFEAVESINQDLPLIDKTFNQHLGWQFLFTMKQNEMFIFPNEKAGFDPSEIDLLDPKNRSLISPNLFRVQKIASKDYFFRHHLETTIDNNSKTKDRTWKRVGLSGLVGIIKVRINHLGEIVKVFSETENSNYFISKQTNNMVHEPQTDYGIKNSISIFQSFEQSKEDEINNILKTPPISRIKNTIALILRAYHLSKDELKNRNPSNKINIIHYS